VPGLFSCNRWRRLSLWPRKASALRRIAPIDSRCVSFTCIVLSDGIFDCFRSQWVKITLNINIIMKKVIIIIWENQPSLIFLTWIRLFLSWENILKFFIVKEIPLCLYLFWLDRLNFWKVWDITCNLVVMWCDLLHVTWYHTFYFGITTQFKF
jgi:hypothetical protein